MGTGFSRPTIDGDCDWKSPDDPFPKCDMAHHETRNWYQLVYLGLVTGLLSIFGSIFMGCATIGVNARIWDACQRASMNGLQSSVASIGRGTGPIVSGYLVRGAM